MLISKTKVGNIILVPLALIFAWFTFSILHFFYWGSAKAEEEQLFVTVLFKTDKTAYEIGEWIIGELHIKNISSDIIYIPDIKEGKGYFRTSCVPHGIVSFILETNGQEVQMLEKWSKKPSDKLSIPVKGLMPGEAVKAKIPLSWNYSSKLFSLDQIGSYRVTAVWDTTGYEGTEIWKGVVKTKPVLFSISEERKFRDIKPNETGLDYATKKVNYYLERIKRKEGSYCGNVFKILNIDDGVPSLILALDLPAKQETAERILIKISSTPESPNDIAGKFQSKEYWQKWWIDIGSKMTVKQLESNFDSHYQ